MKIRIGDVPPGGRVFTGEESPDIVEAAADEDTRVVAPIVCTFTARRSAGTLLVTGELATRVACRCSRCDEPFEKDLHETGFNRVWRLTDDGREWLSRLDDGVEETPEEAAAEQGIAPPQSRESVDLTPDIREAIILAFSGYPVCRPDCKGLRASCGVNLNIATCDCAPPQDNRWAALDEL